jgi:quinolinate synthase
VTSKIISSILDLKKKLGPEILVLAHHYQRLGIVEVADHIGDSFGLAKIASENTKAKKIVFCGVRFMAESAAILCREDQSVYHFDRLNT